MDGLGRGFHEPRPHFCVLSLSAWRSYLPYIAVHIARRGSSWTIPRTSVCLCILACFRGDNLLCCSSVFEGFIDQPGHLSVGEILLCWHMVEETIKQPTPAAAARFHNRSFQIVESLAGMLMDFPIRSSHSRSTFNKLGLDPVNSCHQ